MYMHYIIRPTKIHSRVLTPKQSFIFRHSSDDHRPARRTRHPSIVGGCCLYLRVYTRICVYLYMYIMYIVYLHEKYPPDRWITRDSRCVFTRASTGDKRPSPDVWKTIIYRHIVFSSEQIWTWRPPVVVQAEWQFLHVVKNILCYIIIRYMIALPDTIKRVCTGWPVVLHAHPLFPHLAVIYNLIFRIFRHLNTIFSNSCFVRY